MTTTPTYDPARTGLLLVDPYKDFLSEGGKLWTRVKAVAEQVGLMSVGSTPITPRSHRSGWFSRRPRATARPCVPRGKAVRVPERLWSEPFDPWLDSSTRNTNVIRGLSTNQCRV